MSPTPGRSTLITSAPNHASNCVQVGPDWTWVKSRMRTPFSALVIVLLRTVTAPAPAREGMRAGPWAGPAGRRRLFLLQLALRIEVADPAALAAGRRVQHRIDQGRLARIHRRVDGALEFIRGRRIDADAAERLHHLVVARALDEHGRGGIRADTVDVGAAVNAVVVEDNDADRQLVTADGLDFHAGKTE